MDPLSGEPGFATFATFATFANTNGRFAAYPEADPSLAGWQGPFRVDKRPSVAARDHPASSAVTEETDPVRRQQN